MIVGVIVLYVFGVLLTLGGLVHLIIQRIKTKGKENFEHRDN